MPRRPNAETLRPHRSAAGRRNPAAWLKWMAGAILIATIGCNGSSDQTNAPAPPAETDRQVDRVMLARMAISRGDFSQAQSLLREELEQDQNDPVALELAGDLAVRSGDIREAISRYQGVITNAPEASVALRDKLAQAWMRVGQPYESLAVLEETIRVFPNQAEPRFDLVGLAAMMGLSEPALDSLKWLAMHNQGHQEGLVLLAHPSRLEPDPELCRSVLSDCPEDRRAEYGLARMDAIGGRWESVAQRLEKVIEQHPEFVPAIVLYGRAIVELGDSERIADWAPTLPPASEEVAEFWETAGIWAQAQGDHAAAAKAYWKAVRLDQATNETTLIGLANNLKQIGRDEASKQVAEHADQVAALRDLTKTFFERGSRSQTAAMDVAKKMLVLGRIWEAEGWARWAVQLPEERLQNPKQEYMNVRSKLTAETPWQLAGSLIGEKLDLSDLPELAWKTSDAVPTEKALQSDDLRAEVRLADRAAELGLNHTCELAPGTETDGMWIYQSVGGGVAVIDFDQDGWPDLTFANLDGQPLKEDSTVNRLFQNRDGRFVDVTSLAGLTDRGFAQGITVGDYNADGFPDLFDGNIGRNRLFRNNGDGTFSDVSDQVGLGDDKTAKLDWTTSVAIADLNGDGFADLYEVNYCDGSEPYEQPCRTKGTGKLASCTPLNFRAQRDRVWKGEGDGSFSEATDPWLPNQDGGRGLGIIVGNFDQRAGIDLYIANDMTRNHYLTARRGDDSFGLTDLATIQGLAVNHRSLSQASMGMAVGDPDADGDFDFFITHFSDDHNTYYEQTVWGVWQDRSYAVGLGQESEPLLGFGTEWVDFDNNGSPELIIANGHVTDLRHIGKTYAMPTQVLSRTPEGKWLEIEPERLGGEYFQKPHLGRALVTLDANRDGRTDVAITHIHEPVSLLINETEAADGADSENHSIGLFLVATATQRDAIGAVVTVHSGGEKRIYQVTAGDGFLCSNQRRISAGLGDDAEADSIVVTWPSGSVQTFDAVDGDHDYLLVEGSDSAFPIQAHR